MRCCRFLLAVVIPAALVLPGQAGIFFNRKKPVDPAKRVPELIIALKSESAERKRAAAAEELRRYDTTRFPEIIPALSEAALTDSAAGVRIGAVESLARLRPISSQAGQTLEQVLARDTNLRVRLAARSSLWQYHLSGYRGVAKPETTVATAPTPATTVPTTDSTQPAFPTNAEPPLAPTSATTGPQLIPSPQPLAPLPTGGPAQRMPTGPALPAVTPTEPPQLTNPPVEGPDLGIPH